MPTITCGSSAWALQHLLDEVIELDSTSPVVLSCQQVGYEKITQLCSMFAINTIPSLTYNHIEGNQVPITLYVKEGHILELSFALEYYISFASSPKLKDWCNTNILTIQTW